MDRKTPAHLVVCDAVLAITNDGGSTYVQWSKVTTEGATASTALTPITEKVLCCPVLHPSTASQLQCEVEDGEWQFEVADLVPFLLHGVCVICAMEHDMRIGASCVVSPCFVAQSCLLFLRIRME